MDHFFAQLDPSFQPWSFTNDQAWDGTEGDLEGLDHKWQYSVIGSRASLLRLAAMTESGSITGLCGEAPSLHKESRDGSSPKPALVRSTYFYPISLTSYCIAAKYPLAPHSSHINGLALPTRVLNWKAIF